MKGLRQLNGRAKNPCLEETEAKKLVNGEV